MGLRCILGHDFSEPEVERDREEDGSEVVISVQEVKTCDRCGERQIVSENKEVTSIEQLAGEADRAAADAADATAGDETTGTADADAATADDADGDDGFLANVTSEAESAATDEPTAAETESTAGQTDAEASTGDDADGGAIIIDDGDADDPATETASDAGAESGFDDAESSGPADSAGGDAAADDGDESDDAVIIDDEGNDTPDLGGTEATVAEGSDPEADSDSNATDADADEGVILDEEATAHEHDREHGAWPDHDGRDIEADDHEPWPDQNGADEGYDAEISDEEADVTFGGGLTPERDADADADAATASDAAEAADGDAEFIDGADTSPGGAGESTGDAVESSGESASAAESAATDADEPADASSGITRAESPSLSTRTEGTATEFYCPECGMARAAGGSSMRAGDICPDCRKGYVTEREQ